MRKHIRPVSLRSLLALALAGLLAQSGPAGSLSAQEPAPSQLNIVIVEGDGAINNITQRTAREPIVQIEDENHKPVAGATVVFLLPESGPGGSFAGGAKSLTVVTDDKGIARGSGLQPNSQPGQFRIRVQASAHGQTANTTINQTNRIIKAAIATKTLLLLLLGGAAAATGIALAVHNSGGGGGTTTTQPPIVVTPGTPGVGGPH